jgi:hypothetical protein
LLAAEHNAGFLKRCVGGFRRANFASQASGRVYLRLESGVPVWIDPDAFQVAVSDPDTRAGLEAVAPAARECASRAVDGPQYLGDFADEPASAADQRLLPTLGVWGTERAR